LIQFYQPDILKGIHHLDEDESRHAVKVLRMKVGDALHITDGFGSFYQAIMTGADPRKCMFSIVEKKSVPMRKFSISLAIAPTKNIDRTEWFVEKAVELGIEQIQFMLCQNSERKTVNMERIQKIAGSAMNQSGQAWLPACISIKPFQEVLTTSADQKFICHVDHQNPDQLKSLTTPGKSYFVLIGPEGDFRDEELTQAIDHGFVKVSLGHNRLRTETAALAACHTLNLINL
jgi:16S rRNA (uracil1498-N3)-methyltransferase